MAQPADEEEATRLASSAWGQVARLFLSQQGQREEVATQLGLHMSDLLSLFHLQPDHGIAQRDLAEHWSCDPSWVTSRIDRLEQLGLAERRPSPTDRRVKLVWLTPLGLERRAAGLAGVGRPPEQLLDLPLEDLRALARVLGELDLPDPTVIGLRHLPTSH